MTIPSAHDGAPIDLSNTPDHNISQSEQRLKSMRNKMLSIGDMIDEKNEIKNLER